MNEEFSESAFSIHATPHLQSANQTTVTKQQLNNENQTNQSKPSSTSLGTTLSNGANEISDDETGLIRRRSTGSAKKKVVGSGILRTLFRFGSKKFKEKDKQQSKLSAPSSAVKRELEEEVEKIRARKAALYEQEIIQEYYKRLIDQQKFQQIVSQQTQQRQRILKSPTLNTPPSNCNTLNSTLKKQSTTMHPQSAQQSQHYKKKQEEHQILKNLYVMDNANAQPYFQQSSPLYLQRAANLQAQQSNLHHTLPHSNQITLNSKQMANYETNNYLQTGFAIHNRPKSAYLGGGFENGILVNQNAFQNGVSGHSTDFYNYFDRKVRH